MSLLEEQPRQVSARALTGYKLLRIDHSTFDQMVEEKPEIAVRMLRKGAVKMTKRGRTAPGTARGLPMAGARPLGRHHRNVRSDRTVRRRAQH